MPAAAILNTSLVPMASGMHVWRMVDSIQPYQFEPLMMAEELASYRERVGSRREGNSDSEVEGRSDEDSRIGNSC